MTRKFLVVLVSEEDARAYVLVVSVPRLVMLLDSPRSCRNSVGWSGQQVHI